MFNKYRSIENSYQTKFIQKIKEYGLGESKYIVQEKAHGSNLSYITDDGVDFVTAKRNGILNEDEKFYNYDIILAELKPKFISIWHDLKAKYPQMSQMTIFGEVIGGNYPHPDIKANFQASKVQKGIHYSPDNLFYAFDILIDEDNYLDVTEANQYFAQEELLYAKTLFQGNLDECLAYPNNFSSTIALDLGLPEIQPNICEGVVIKPIQNTYLPNGTRVILKNKNEKWSEKNRRANKSSTKKENVASEKVLKWQEEISAYVTENRLDNVISKIGEVTEKDFGQILKMLNQDITEDFFKDFPHLKDELDKKEIKLLTKYIQIPAVRLVRQRLFNS